MHFRSIFLSDIHLGSPDCQADTLIDFLNQNSCDELYLVGDIVDFWVLEKKKKKSWPDSHTQVLSRFLELPQTGTKVYYIPGNHDDMVRKVYGSQISGIEVSDEIVYTTRKGKRWLILHGDLFDEVVLTNDWQHRLGGDLYDMLMGISRRLNAIRSILGYAHWSLANWLKYKFEKAVKHIQDYEYAAAKEAATRFLDGVVCGHIHHPNQTNVDGIEYLNCGDWVEHCTAIAETQAGEVMMINWPNDRQRLIDLSLMASKTTKQQRQELERAA
ncbi:MAG: UDP-2,3-diacylglucosamine diphosphatase [Pseudomonadales bacterium]|nr:UDP-2,3-diacylglucosamine diphosphatase [Pseudomonadales bacterium]